jgi:hypothetical protein
MAASVIDESQRYSGRPAGESAKIECNASGDEKA